MTFSWLAWVLLPMLHSEGLPRFTVSRIAALPDGPAVTFAIRNDNRKVITAYVVRARWPATSRQPDEIGSDLWSEMSIRARGPQPPHFEPGSVRKVSFLLEHGAAPEVEVIAAIFADQTWTGEEAHLRRLVEYRLGTYAALLQIVSKMEDGNRQSPDDPRMALESAARAIKQVRASPLNCGRHWEETAWSSTLDSYAEILETAAQDIQQEEIPLVMTQHRLDELKADLAALRTQRQLVPALEIDPP